MTRLLTAVLALSITCCAPGKKPVWEDARRPIPLPRTFDLYVAQNPRLFIWDTHPVDASFLTQSVCEALTGFGFHRTTPDRADLLVNIQVFASDRNPKDRILVVEGLEPSRLWRVWLGQTTISGDPRNLDLNAFLASLGLASGVAAPPADSGRRATPGALLGKAPARALDKVLCP